MIVGLVGPSGVGKDTFADMLKPKFEKRAFADKVREALYALNPFVKLDNDLPPQLSTGHYYLQSVVDRYGWDVIKRHPNVRKLLQRMGTEVGRNIMCEDIWIQLMFQYYIDTDLWVISDVRFQNEALAIQRYRRGILILIERDVESIGNHISELDYLEIKPDIVIINNGTIEELREKANKFLEHFNNILNPAQAWSNFVGEVIGVFERW